MIAIGQQLASTAQAGPPARRVLARLRSVRSEGGFALLEVVVAAALLAVVGIGVYAGIDGPAQVSGQSRVRSSAAQIAQDDQERLRSLDFDHLQSYADAPYTKTLNGTTFTVTSRTDWVEDRSGTPSCTNDSTTADYLQLSSTVTWPSQNGAPPVALKSLESPPAGTGSTIRGNLSVKVTDENDNPVDGLPISIAGRTNQTRSTNAAGCAVFTYIPVGQYTITGSRDGWVDQNGQPSLDDTATVSGNTTATDSFSYAPATQIDVAFDNSAGASRSYTSATFSAAGMSGPKTVTSPTAVTTISSGALYPWSGGYTVWAGGCTANPYTTYGIAPVQVNALRGGAYSVTARLATLSVTSNVPMDHLVYAGDQTAANCPVPVSKTRATPGATAYQLDLPYGDYDICADRTTGSGRTAVTYNKHIVWPGVQNLVSGGTPLALAIPTSGNTSKTACP